jgi:hypothetical protein
LNELRPCIGDAVRYLISATGTYASWKDIGATLVAAFGSSFVGSSEYVHAVLIDLFGRNVDTKHFRPILKDYELALPLVKRKIVRAATNAGADYWLRERKPNGGA